MCCTLPEVVSGNPSAPALFRHTSSPSPLGWFCLPPCAFPFTGFKPEPTSRMTGLTDSSPWACYVHVHICRAVMCACDATSLPKHACKPTSSSVAYKPTASCSLVPILINFFCVCSKEQHTMSDMWTFY